MFFRIAHLACSLDENIQKETPKPVQAKFEQGMKKFIRNQKRKSKKE